MNALIKIYIKHAASATFNKNSYTQITKIDESNYHN